MCTTLCFVLFRLALVKYSISPYGWTQNDKGKYSSSRLSIWVQLYTILQLDSYYHSVR